MNNQFDKYSKYREIREANGKEFFSKLINVNCENMSKTELLDILFGLNMNYDLDKMKVRKEFSPCVGLVMNEGTSKDTCKCITNFIIHFGCASNYYYK